MGIFNKNRALHSANRTIRLGKRKRFSNPVRVEKRARSIKIFRIINIILLIGIGAAVYFFIFSPHFIIRQVIIEGNEVIAAQDILDISDGYLREKTWGILAANNIFICNKRGLIQRISNKFIIDSIRVSKTLPDTIIIHIDEKLSAVQFISNDMTYLIDTEGTVIKEVFSRSRSFKVFELIEPAEEEASSIPLIENGFLNIINKGNEPISIGEKVINKEHIVFIQNLYNTLASKTYIKVSGISVPQRFPQTMTVETEGGWSILFNINDSLEAQLSRLEPLINEKITKERLSQIDYIDLTLGESVYYKFK